MPKPKHKTGRRNPASARNGLKGGRPLVPRASADPAKPDQPDGDRDPMMQVAMRRARARMAREEAQAIRERAKADRERGLLCLRSEAIAEAGRLGALIKAELGRAKAFLDPGLAPEVRQACESALAAASGRVLAALAKGARIGA